MAGLSGNVWFTADLHLGHRFVAGLRGFDNVAEHDAAVLASWHRLNLKADDQIWVLGDLALSGHIHALAMLRELPGTKHLIVGNHDAAHPLHRDAHKHQRDYLLTFASVQAFARRRINGVEVLLSHFPYGQDHSPEPRYTQYRLRDEGRWLLHGHTHGTERRHGHQIHVGVDAWDLAPVPLSAIATLLEAE